MITAIFTLLMITVFGKMISFVFRLTWGIAKVSIFLVFIPIALIAMFIAGLVMFCLPILLITGIVLLMKPKRIL